MSIEDTERREAMLAAIIDNSDDAIISKDLNGIITSWNKSAERIFEFTEQEAIGKHITILIPPDRIDEETMILSNLRSGKRIEHYETVRQSKSGKKIHISLTVSPIKNSQGTIVGASKIARDITRQKEAQELLRQYTERMETINNIGRTIVSELDAESILQKVTDATTKISGAAYGAFFYNITDARGKAYMLVKLSGAPIEAFEKFGMPRNTEVFKKTFDGEGIFRSDNIKKDPRYGKNAPYKGMPEGHLPVVSYLAVPVISQSGVVVGGLFFGHPEEAVFKEEHEALVSAIAIQASIALDNAKLYEEIKQLNIQKDEFIGFASHELKTPLTTAMGYVQLIENEPEMTPEFISKIKKQMKRLSAIIADLLDISRIQAGRLDLEFRRTSLKELVKNSIEALGPAANTHTIECELPVEDFTVMIDERKMEQVLVNILSNAIKYSPKSNKVLLRTIVLGGDVQISIKDYGPGIPGEHIDKIFKRFYRVSHTGNNAEGLGLGLYISQGIIEAHAGKIWAESEPGSGAEFYISFPVERMKYL